MDYDQPGSEESSDGVKLPSPSNLVTSVATASAATTYESETTHPSVSRPSVTLQCPPSKLNTFTTRPPGAHTLEELIGTARNLATNASSPDTPISNVNESISAMRMPPDGPVNPVSQLYELSASRGITPVFDVAPSGPFGFSVVLTLGAEIPALQDQGPFPSKSVAKYTIARRACEVVQKVPQLKTQKTLIGGSGSISDQENYIGILHGQP